MPTLPALRALGLVLATLVSCLAFRAAKPESRRPNLLVIIADDLGYADVGAPGGKEIPTPNLDTKGPNPIRRGLKPVVETNYLTDAFSREAVSFIERHRAEPFYLQLAFNAVHSPLDAHPKCYGRFAHIADEKRRRYASAYAAMDDGISRVLKTLRDSGLDEDTLVFFFSDNGGPTNDNTSRNEPLRGFKAQTWEGGIHIPFFVRWKGTLPSGRVYSQPVIQLDVHATAPAAAGLDVRPEWKLDGANLLPYLAGRRKDAPHDALYWRFGSQIGVRSGDWKLVKAQTGEPSMGAIDGSKANTDGAQLYNFATDLGEKHDLAASRPDKSRELSALWNRWNAELPNPAWKPGRGGPQGTNRPPAREATVG